MDPALYRYPAYFAMQALGPAVVDNYFIRSLLGEEVFHAPVGGITEDMLKLAKQVLVQFDLLMVLEQVGRGCRAT